MLQHFIDAIGIVVGLLGLAALWIDPREEKNPSFAVTFRGTFTARPMISSDLNFERSVFLGYALAVFHLDAADS